MKEFNKDKFDFGKKFEVLISKIEVENNKSLLVVFMDIDEIVF